MHKRYVNEACRNTLNEVRQKQVGATVPPLLSSPQESLQLSRIVKEQCVGPGI